MNDGANFVPFYPWSEGDRLYASALNAAIANSVSLGGDNKNWRTAYDFGAVGSTATVWNDDTAALNAAFAQTSAEGGGRIYFPGTFYAAGALTVPPNVEIYGNFATGSQASAPAQSYFQMGGSKLILGTSGMTLDRSCILRNIMVIAASAPQTNPMNLAQSQAVITAMLTAGTGIEVIGDNCLIDTVQVLGFNYGIRCVNNPAVNRQMWRNIHGDNTNCIWIDTGGDMCHIIGAHFWPYLTVMDPGATGAGYAGLQRSGTGIYTRNNGGSIQIAQCTVFGWQQCYWAADNSVTWTQCWADGNAPQSVGFYASGNCGLLQMVSCIAVANQFGVRHSVSNGAVFNIAGCQFIAGGPGGTDPVAGLMALGIYADGHGPIQCVGSSFGGGNALIWLGPNTGPSTIIGNVFDDIASNLGYVWHVDPAVIPLITKHSNRVINSPGGIAESGNLAQTSVGFYDSMPNFMGGMAMTAPVKLFAVDGGTASPSILWQSAGGAADSHIWDAFASSGSFAFRMINDADSAANQWLTVTRSGYAPGTITLSASGIELNGAVGFNGTAPLPKPTIGGSRGGITALGQVISMLVAYGLANDSTTP